MGAAGKLLLLTMAVMSSTAAEESQMKYAVNSLNKLLDYMLQPRSVIGDMVFGVVMARGKPKYLQVSSHVARNTSYAHITHCFYRSACSFKKTPDSES
jgi:hypothetical protein